MFNQMNPSINDDNMETYTFHSTGWKDTRNNDNSGSCTIDSRLCDIYNDVLGIFVHVISAPDAENKSQFNTLDSAKGSKLQLKRLQTTTSKASDIPKESKCELTKLHIDASNISDSPKITKDELTRLQTPVSNSSSFLSDGTDMLDLSYATKSYYSEKDYREMKDSPSGSFARKKLLKDSPKNVRNYQSGILPAKNTLFIVTPTYTSTVGENTPDDDISFITEAEIDDGELTRMSSTRSRSEMTNLLPNECYFFEGYSNDSYDFPPLDTVVTTYSSSDGLSLDE